MPFGVDNRLYKVEFIKLLNKSKSKSPLINSLAFFAKFRIIKTSFSGFTCFGLFLF